MPDSTDWLATLRVHDHLCLIYQSVEEQFSAIAPFFTEGLERGERCVYIADEHSPSFVFQSLCDQIDTGWAAVSNGAILVVTKHDSYLQNGYFDPEQMIAFFGELVQSAKSEGFTGIRVAAEMTWALGDEVGVDRVMEYEAKVNDLFSYSDMVGICQYNLRRFTPEVVREVIHTHPLVLYGGQVNRNPYYLPPAEYLKPKMDDQELRRLLETIVARQAYPQPVLARA